MLNIKQDIKQVDPPRFVPPLRAGIVPHALDATVGPKYSSHFNVYRELTNQAAILSTRGSILSLIGGAGVPSGGIS